MLTPVIYFLLSLICTISVPFLSDPSSPSIIFLHYCTALENISIDSGSGSTQGPYEIKTVTLLQGEPFEIPCSISTISTPSHIDWYKNGTLINNKKVRMNAYVLVLFQSWSSWVFLFMIVYVFRPMPGRHVGILCV